ncbi:MAG: hypothetical protein CMD78_02205 [Gammaproteobacteria bacterium]|nr:hypothetical protein [Gammaproteobacteria bacterium]|tara:strand:- start:6282 stop:7403 length:1122 start_codon:yes stop_codon:yes gene_type:complete
MRVLHTITSLQTGGAETVLCRILTNLEAEKVKLHRVISLGPGGSLSKQISKAGATVDILGSTKRISAPLLLMKVLTIANQFKPDICIGWMYDGNLAAWIASRKTRTPLVWNIRHSISDIANETIGTRLAIKLNSLLSSAPTTISYNSKIAADQHVGLGFPADKVEVIPNGFNTNQFRPNQISCREWREKLGIKPNTFVVGHVARYHPMKGHKTLLKAIDHFSRLASNIKLVMAGRDVDSQNRELNSFITKNNLDHLVVLLGEVSDTETLNPMFDVSVSSSIWGEGFSNTLGESMACGTPVIATNVGDSASLVGDAGIVVEPNNVDALAQSLWSFYQQTETERTQFRQRARARIVDQFGIDRMINAYQDIFLPH